MNERDLLILKYLNIFRNITKTANALFISQPALTTRIKQLERELNTKLINSTNKGVFLTPTGLEMASFADETLKRFDDIKERLQAIDDENAGIIKLAAPNIISEYYLPQLIIAFKKLHPKVKFSITMTHSSEVVNLVNNNKCNFGFLRNDFGWEQEQSHIISTNHIAAVSLSPFALKDLANMSRVAYSTDTYYMKMLDLWWSNNFPTPPKIDVLVNTLDLAKEMVFNGLGFGLLPSVFLPQCPEAHYIILKDKAGNPIERHTRLIYKKSNLTNNLLKDFQSFITQENFNKFLRLKLYTTQTENE